MKLVAIEMSRLTAIFQTTRKRGQAYLPVAAAMVAERYRFAKTPSSYQELAADRIEFRHGLFDDNAIETLEIYSDGLIISSRSNSDFIEKFLDDLIVFAESELGISIIKTNDVDRLYESTLIVETDKNILDPLTALGSLLPEISSYLQQNSNLQVEYVPFSIAFAGDQTKNPFLKPVPFRFERRAGSEFALNHYFAVAPLKTSQHLAVLENLESLV